MITMEFHEGGMARASGLRIHDNPYKQGITEESVKAYCDWLDGYLNACYPFILDDKGVDNVQASS